MQPIVNDLSGFSSFCNVLVEFRDHILHLGEQSNPGLSHQQILTSLRQDITPHNLYSRDSLRGAYHLSHHPKSIDSFGDIVCSAPADEHDYIGVGWSVLFVRRGQSWMFQAPTWEPVQDCNGRHSGERHQRGGCKDNTSSQLQVQAWKAQIQRATWGFVWRRACLIFRTFSGPWFVGKSKIAVPA